MTTSPITLGHLLMLLALVAALWGAWQLVIALRHRAYGRGTPQYARARDGRRYALYGFAAAGLLFAAGCLTPLGRIALG